MLTSRLTPHTINSVPHWRILGNPVSGRNVMTRKCRMANGLKSRAMTAVKSTSSAASPSASASASVIQNSDVNSNNNDNDNDGLYQVWAVVRIKKKIKMSLVDKVENQWLNYKISVGQAIFLQIISQDNIDPDTNSGKTVEAYVRDWPSPANPSSSSSEHSNSDEYVVDFSVPSDFGHPGAILITNCHSKEFYLEEIVLQGFGHGHGHGPLVFPAKSWIHSCNDNPETRIIFGNHAYLPSETPSGIKDLRRKELLSIRGDGKGERKRHERVYDYAPCNNMGDPDKHPDLARPLLSGTQFPYPRRCRSGRPPTKTDPECESRTEKAPYVPRDEALEQIKQAMLSAIKQKAILHNLVPLVATSLSNSDISFRNFSEFDKLYVDDDFPAKDDVTNRVLSIKNALKFDVPAVIRKDRFSWLRDSEFARQAVAGINPMNIELLQEFPIMSKLDPTVYGPPESAITKEVLEEKMDGMTVDEAIENKRLFIIDYHDLILPFVNKINELQGRKIYAPRAVFFQAKDGSLQPIVIELTLPATQSSPTFKRAYTHGNGATSHWLWNLAKAHFCAVDATVHGLVNHWLRAHACAEAYIIATHRQLSRMHPVFKLLHPHMRYTMASNANARQGTFNGGGLVEAFSTPGKYCMDISSAAYKTMWRFDHQALPADLLQRGMAEPDPTEPTGVKLVMEDYPYAADGLLVWSAIKEWVQSYVLHFYPNPKTVTDDLELQQWWHEIKTEGHADKKTEPWWPKLQTSDDLTDILTTVIWTGSGYHAAINFGQYPFGGYVPNRPSLMRKLIPQETEPEYEKFVNDPTETFLSSLPSVLQTTKSMTLHDVVSTHSPDEEYLGQDYSFFSRWTDDEEVKSMFERFSSRLKEIEEIIHQRNKNTKLENRIGAGVPSYEIFLPTSGPGVTGRGVPNSITI